MSLRAIAVQHLDQIEEIRRIRNITAAGFSHHTDQIPEYDHMIWWEQAKPLAWLYARPDGIMVGFGLLRQDEQGRWVTVVAVLPEYGGRGHGRFITHDIVMRSPGRVWATARKDNPAAVKLHQACDWETISGSDPRLVYFRGRRGAPEPEPRDYRFAMQPSLLPKIATETTEHATVEWCPQPDGRTVRVVSWAQPGVQPVASPWPPDGALEQWAESGWAQSIYSLVGESGPELCLPGRVGNVLPKNPWIDPTTGQELSR